MFIRTDLLKFLIKENREGCLSKGRVHSRATSGRITSSAWFLRKNWDQKEENLSWYDFHVKSMCQNISLAKRRKENWWTATYVAIYWPHQQSTCWTRSRQNILHACSYYAPRRWALHSNFSINTISRSWWRNLLREIRQRRKNIRLSWTRSPHILLGCFWRVLELSSNTECAQGSQNWIIANLTDLGLDLGSAIWPRRGAFLYGFFW